MHTVGIDLGTTYCAVAQLDERGKPVTIPNRDGEVLTPSAIYFAGENQVVVGKAALDVSLEQPENVATLVKRQMGRADYGRPVAGRNFRPESLAAVILRKLVQDAQHQIGPISKAVITVPAYFDDARRKATMDAGRIAGLEILDIIDEPSAAALAYTVQQSALAKLAPGELPNDAPRLVLVYDLGGGTFDVTLVKLGRKHFQVLGIEGEIFLGGRDWDERLAKYVAELFQKEYGTDPLSDSQSAALLFASAERAKCTLSKVPAATMTCSHAGRMMKTSVTRELFEGLSRDLLLRTRMTTRTLLSRANRTWGEIDKVLLVGGSTHMPMIAAMLRELTSQEPERNLAVSEIVARGAAAHAGILQARQRPEDLTREQAQYAEIVEVNVSAHSLGVEIRQGRERLNNKLILKNTQLPAQVNRVYRTVQDGQTRVRVRILQGEANQAEACIPVGDCWIVDLPPKLPKGTPIEVRCAMASNGRIQVTAIDQLTGRSASVELQHNSGLTEAQLASEAAWLNTLQIQ
jgi:molecular chaperone DnaK